MLPQISCNLCGCLANIMENILSYLQARCKNHYYYYYYRSTTSITIYTVAVIQPNFHLYFFSFIHDITILICLSCTIIVIIFSISNSYWTFNAKASCIAVYYLRWPVPRGEFFA